LGCQYVIVGHSERRNYFGETVQIINQKLKIALRYGLKPILCIGETERNDANDEQDTVSKVLTEQLEQGLSGINQGKITEVVIAYEPIWAIGTGNFCSFQQAQEAGLFIRKVLTKLYSRKIAEKISILYGGSVNSQNSSSYVKEARLNGLLVGGSSLVVSEFVRILESLRE